MLDWIDIVLLSLAVWRVARMVTTEAGPRDVFGALRHSLGVHPEEIDNYGDFIPYRETPGSLADWISCTWCFSVITAAVIGWLYLFWPREVLVVTMPFWLSAGAIIVNRLVQR